MATGGNRRRNSNKRRTDFRAFWGSLFHKEKPTDDVGNVSLYEEEAEDADADNEKVPNLWQRIVEHICVWKLIAGLIFAFFVGFLALMVIWMWQPQDISDIEGYKDNIASRNLTRLICNKTAQGEPIIIREDDVNRCLRDTCSMKQDGFFSIFAECRGVAFRFHKGYAEFVIERGFGPLTTQTTTVNISFHYEFVNGQPKLCAKLHGGAPIMGSMPRGGSIGSMPIPQRHIIILQPALESLRDCYPEIRDAVEKHGYCPFFEEGRVELRPYTSQQTNTD